MSATVTIKLKNGLVQKFSDSRVGGSYTNRVRYEGAFVVVVDVWGNEHAYPAADVEKVETRNDGGYY